jgi:transketolase
MGAISQTNVNFVGSHCGVSIGEDGPSQMALEDLAMFRSIPGSTVFYPSDAVATERAVELAANTKGICFIRTSRPNTPVIYKNDEVLSIGKAKIIRSSSDDQALLIGVGVTLHEAIKAADILAKSGINVRVMDPFTIKPIDQEAIIENSLQARGRIVTIEDHYPEGGLGEAVLSAISEHPNLILKKLAVKDVPRSGKPDELLNYYGIDDKSIAKHTEDFIKN